MRVLQRAFTLVEVLVVMVIISMLAGMVVTSVQGVTRTAREARTRSIIAAIDTALQEKYNAIRYRAFPVEIPTLADASMSDPDTEFAYTLLADEAARVRLVMLRDTMRTEMPERYSDIYDASSTIVAACSLVKLVGGNIQAARLDLPARRPFNVAWGSTTSAAQARFQARLSGLTRTDIASENANAECLYLIMASTFVGGSPAIDSIPTSNIGDTDGDTVPEILDGFGNPIAFIRWPAGYAQNDSGFRTDVADDFDLFKADWAYQFSTIPALQANVTHPLFAGGTYAPSMPWSMRPMVVSAGSDGEFGIAINPVNDSGNAEADYSFTATSEAWPQDNNHMGVQHQGRGTGSPAYFYPDPYYRQFIEENDPAATDRTATKRRLPGEVLDAADTSATDDNISNFSLAGTSS